MIFYFEGKKIPIDDKLVEKHMKITNESISSMQLILKVILRNIANIDNPEEIVLRYSEVEIKNMIEAQIKKEICSLS